MTKGEFTEIVSGLRFPEGPIAMSDGSIILTELAIGAVTWLTAEGEVRRRYEIGGGPNGAAIGPDGALYITNNGGCFTWHEVMDLTVPGPVPPEWTGGSIQRLDLDTGEVTTLYTDFTGTDGETHRLRAPNDLVFDSSGGFWFTDHGVRLSRTSDLTGIYYGRADGSSCVEKVHPLEGPNGIGLAPDGSRVYAAETSIGRIWGWDLSGPGELADTNVQPIAPGGATLMFGAPGLQYFDSLAVDGDGWVCVATIGNGGITCVSPDTTEVEHIPFPDLLVTNICFGGDDLQTAFITLSGTGRLVKAPWHRPGLELAFTR